MTFTLIHVVISLIGIASGLIVLFGMFGGNRMSGMTALFLHEGQPGHHFQMSLQQELALPDFRKYGWSTAYGEGWALYAETLGRELGLYDDPNQYLGHLKLELMRAVRLVTDTGLHAKGWTREQSIQYMIDTKLPMTKTREHE